MIIQSNQNAYLSTFQSLPLFKLQSLHPAFDAPFLLNNYKGREEKKKRDNIFTVSSYHRLSLLASAILSTCKNVPRLDFTAKRSRRRSNVDRRWFASNVVSRVKLFRTQSCPRQEVCTSALKSRQRRRRRRRLLDAHVFPSHTDCSNEHAPDPTWLFSHSTLRWFSPARSHL